MFGIAEIVAHVRAVVMDVCTIAVDVAAIGGDLSIVLVRFLTITRDSRPVLCEIVFVVVLEVASVLRLSAIQACFVVVAISAFGVQLAIVLADVAPIGDNIFVVVAQIAPVVPQVASIVVYVG